MAKRDYIRGVMETMAVLRLGRVVLIVKKAQHQRSLSQDLSLSKPARDYHRGQADALFALADRAIAWGHDCQALVDHEKAR